MRSLEQFISKSGERGIVTTAPCRADLAGGTLDIWPLYLFHPGAVSVNVALRVLTACRITPQAGQRNQSAIVRYVREESFDSLDALLAAKAYRHALAAYLVRFFQPAGRIRAGNISESPAGAGISGSSALMIASAAALARFAGRDIPIEQIRVIAQNVEAQLIRVPTGCQDYYLRCMAE